ncbi:MAG: GNAT family N-acetyltransferase [Albidovulum sp.]|nr:GNAT family N-acetyltransferase [Albidovulum sp.]
MTYSAGEVVEYTVTYLEMDEPRKWIDPPPPAGTGPELRFDGNPSPSDFFKLYDMVGRMHGWTDMHYWSSRRIERFLRHPRVSMSTMIVASEPGGFFLLDGRRSGECNIGFFGLSRKWIGKGLGAWLLKTAISDAWSMNGVEKVSVNTCTLDHPRALGLYKEHGLVAVRKVERKRKLVNDLDPAVKP